MRLLRYSLVPWMVFAVYSLFSSVLGQNGLYARKHLEAERLRLLENRNILEYTHQDFLKMRDNLMYDKDTLSVYARQLGYAKENEQFLRIKGLGVAVNTNMPAGQVLYASGPHFVSDTVIKIISVFFGLIVLIFFLINDFYVLKDFFISR